MAKPLSLPGAIRFGIMCGAIPERAEVKRNGAQWDEGDLTIYVWLQRTYDHSLVWNAHVGDRQLDDALKKYGGLTIPINGLIDSMPWPTGPMPELTTFLQRGIGAVASFVKDRTDLCRLSMENGDVLRGELYAWLPNGTYPGRLVQALILAREIGLPEYEDGVIERLRDNTLLDAAGMPRDLKKEAQYWAKVFGKALKREILF